MKKEAAATEAVDEINKLLPSNLTSVGQMAVFQIVLEAIQKSDTGDWVSKKRTSVSPRCAFPWSDEQFCSDGMTLREWYAGMALVGLLSNVSFDSSATPIALAETSFKIADEMVKASETRRVG